MLYLLLGLVFFIGVHSIRIVANDWRGRTLGRVGESSYKGVYTLVSVLGFCLIVWGFGLAREVPVVLWSPPLAMRHAASLLTLLAFIFLAAAYVPRNGLKARFHHPMVLGVKSWALAHLLSTGNLAHAVLFGAFLAWAVASFVAARRRDRASGTVYVAGTWTGTLVTLIVGVAAWATFAFWLHGMLIGIKPFS